MAKTTIKGMDALRRKLAVFPDAIDRAAKRAVAGEVDDAADDVHSNAPVETGSLRDSVQREIDPDGLGGRVVVTASYATFVENGTDDTPPQPFVQPAAERSRHRYVDRMRTELSAEIKKVSKS